MKTVTSSTDATIPALWKSKWFGIDKCHKCNEPVNRNDWLIANSVCPHCGYQEFAGDLKRVSVRLILIRRAVWWKKLLGLDSDEYITEVRE